MANKKIDEMEQNWKRALADYQNLVKRTQEQQGQARTYACLSLTERLLPVLDHLQLAAKHLNDPGLAMVVDQFKQALTAEGVVEITALNEPFDPMTMECVEQADGPKDQVIEVVSSGYKLSDRVIRPAKVKVGITNINQNNQQTN